MGDMEAKTLWKKEKGGFRAAIFVYVMISLESIAFVSNMVSMVLYFYAVMHFDVSNSANTLTNFLGSTFLLTVFGGFISDTYLNRFHTILIFGVIEILALVLVTIQAYSKQLQPECSGRKSCLEGGKEIMFYTSLCLLALGTGGVRGTLPSHGADQFNEKDPVEAKALASYFNWIVLATVLGASIGVTGVVWVSVNIAWYKGFIISTVATFLGFVFFAAGMPFYSLRKPAQSPFIRIAQVIVLAIKNRKLPLPENPDELYELTYAEKFSTEEKIGHTDQFRIFDKAAILPKDTQPGPWKVCTVTQVEELKILTRMLPILLSTVVMNTCLAQLQTFSVQQGYKMDLHLGKNFKVPPPSIPIIPLVFMIILIPLYDLLFVPFARKFTGHPSGITQLQRVGVGLVLSVVSMAVAALVEVKRRKHSLKDPYHPISLFWLSFQYAIFGVADMFTLVGLLEFFYKEAPAGMKSLSTSFTFLSLSFGYFSSTIFVDVINAVTKRITPSKQGWLHGQLLDYNNLDLFYLFLAILSSLNFLVYLYMASWYKYKAEDTNSKLTPSGLLPAKVEKENPEVKTDAEGNAKESKVAETNRESAEESDEAKTNAEESTVANNEEEAKDGKENEANQ